MRSAIVVPLLFVAAAVGQTPGVLPGQKQADADKLAAINKELEQLAAELQEARGLAGVVTDRGVRAKLTPVLERAAERLKELQKTVRTLASVPTAAMTADEFGRVLAAVKAEPFDDRRYNVLDDRTRSQTITCQQAGQLVKLFNFSAGQVRAATLLHGRLVDPANFNDVLAVMPFNSDRDAVRRATGAK